MRKKTLGAAALALAIGVAALPALSTAAPDTAELTAKLTGDAEVPEAGSPKGKGDAIVEATPSKKKLCFVLNVKKLDTVNAAHIHKGAEGVAGDVVVPFFENEELDGTGSYEGCVKKVEKKLLEKIINKPEKYYVNVHTAEFPAGAIRGQLAAVEEVEER